MSNPSTPPGAKRRRNIGLVRALGIPDPSEAPTKVENDDDPPTQLEQQQVVFVVDNIPAAAKAAVSAGPGAPVVQWWARAEDLPEHHVSNETSNHLFDLRLFFF